MRVTTPIRPKNCKNTECGKTFTPSFSSLQQVCSTACAMVLSKVVALNKEKKKAATEKRAWHLVNDKLSIFENRLQIEINAIARAIDNGCNCLACSPETPIKKQFASHFHAVGSNPSLRFNLHVLHNGCFSCNGMKGGNILAYMRGLKRVYGKRYAEYVESDIVAEYPVMKWSREQLCEWIKQAKKIRKELEAEPKEYTPQGRIMKREQINKTLGIYTKDFTNN